MDANLTRSFKIRETKCFPLPSSDRNGESRFLSSRRGMAVAVIESGPRLKGPPLLALNHVVQVSTLRGRACMNVAGCLLANEQLVTIRGSRRHSCRPFRG